VNRALTISGWTLLIVGGWGFWIVLLASPINGAIWSDANMWAPWNHQAKFDWMMRMASALKSSVVWLAAMGVCLVLAFAGGRLRKAGEARRLRVSSVAK
jgi:hypothetical protein